MMINAGVDLLLYDLTPPITSYLDSGGFGLGLNCTPQLSASPDGQAQGAHIEVLNTLAGVAGVSICDGCRWGGLTSTSDGAAYVFDLGTGTIPGFVSKYRFTNPNGVAQIQGTFKVGAQQFMVAYGVDGACGTGASAVPGIYQITADPSGEPVLSNPVCVDKALFNPLYTLQKGGILFYVQQGLFDVHVAKLDGTLPPPEIGVYPGATFGVPPVPSPVSVDMRNYPSGDGYMLVINYGHTPAATLYRIHDDNGSPVITAALQFTDQNWSSGAVNFPYIFLASQGGFAAPREMYSCEDTGSAITCSPVDHDYWNDPAADYNSPKKKDIVFLGDMGPEFSYDGQYMFFGRYFFMPLFKFTGPAEPTPAVSNSPLNPFPGDAVTVRNDSTNWDQAALWVTETADGSGTLLAGSPVPAAGVTQLSWPSSDALDCTLPYWEHVDIRPIPQSGVSQADQQINFNCSPTATVSVSPQTALVGSTVTVTANAEGHPGSDTGADPYQWTITKPDQTVIPGTTGPSVQVTIDQSGDWSFQVKVQYKHTTTAGVYSYTSTPLLKSYASVAPAISVTPATPAMDDLVILGADGSLVGENVRAFYTYYLDGVAQTACQDWVTGGPGGAVTIPDCQVGVLSIGPHTAKLQLTAGQDDLTSDPLSFNVVDTSAAFTVTPNNPQIGQDVSIAVTNGTVQSWNMGGKNCAGDGPTINCQPFCNLWTNFQWAYDSSGTKTIELHTTEGGVATQTVNVQATGKCPVTCTYSVSPSSLSVSAAGGQQTVSVGAGPTCQWSARSNVSWITAVSPSSSSGNAFVTFNVAVNSGSARNGTLTIAGKPVTVNQSASGSGSGFTISDTTPDIGQTVTFTTSASPTSWDMGGPNCAGESQIIPCPNPALCQQVTWSYPTQGTKTVKLTTSAGTTVKSLTVQSTGVCPGTNCEYALSPTSASVPADGDSGSFDVVTDAGCPWTATTSDDWIRITAGSSGAGSGTVTYAVDPNLEPGDRTGSIQVKDQTFTITQAGAVAKNAIIPVVANTVGLGGTDWRTDMWIHNPNTVGVPVSVRFFPENTDNTDVPDGPPIDQPLLKANGTLYLPNILQSVDPNGNLKGALGISVDSGELTMPLVTSSRTYNLKAGGGTYGQFVPVVEGDLQPVSQIILTGLRHDADYRTNVGLVSGADRAIGGVTIHVLNAGGAEVGSYGLGLLPFGMTQVDGLLDKLDPSPGPMDNFTVVVDFDDGQGGKVSQPVRAYASVVDNRTGDAIFIPGQTVDGGAGAAGASFVVRQLTTSAALGIQALDFTISNAAPQKGETVTFTVTGDYKQIASWDFGGVDCDGTGPTVTCDQFFGCGLNGLMTWTYAGAGAKTVTAHLVGGGSISHSLTVQDAGSCPGGGCSYAVSPTSLTVAAGGETKSVNVTADAGCSWSASVTAGSSWLHIDSGSPGAGNGAVSFTADANSSEQSRTGTLSVAGKMVTVQQDLVPPQIPGNGELLIPAAAHTVGEFGTAWQTDLWIFNPGTSSVTADVRFYQSNRDNSGVDAADPLLEQTLAPHATLFVPNIVAQVDPEANLSGALRVGAGGTGSPLVVSSRTYNTEDTGGTYGQFVPASSGSDLAVHQLLLTGLRHDADFRTNIGLASSSPNAIGGIVIHVLDDNGTERGTYELGLLPYGMTQVDSVLEKMTPPLTSLQTFSVVIDFRDGQGNPAAADQPVTAYASVIDNQTGDATFIPAIRER